MMVKRTIIWVGILLLACSAVGGHGATGCLGLRSFVAPTYPSVARHARIQGKVHLTVILDPGGKVLSVESASGPEILVAYAKTNVVRWTYSPTNRRMKLDVSYSYRLEEPEMEETPIPRIVLESPVHIVITSNLPRIAG
jgi:TonB family protein